ncbi:MAG: adenylyltransferase/cytidyltransferase family protein [Lentisphaeria bacterium]|nr:adenylyltransferase/cytidyltransferase family protein [Lentisphaeria bacterium]
MSGNLISPEKRIFTSLDAAAEWRAELRRQGRTLAVTNGCFDILHRGHAEYLFAARKTADALLVLVNSDKSVRSLKGPNRPVNTEYDRAYLLASMNCVDAVLIFDAVRCARELDVLAPDAYAKGGDYTLDTLEATERAALLRHGTQVHFIPFVPDHSTTLILKKAGQC